MALTPSQALTKRARDNALMPPPPPPKRQKRPPKVLDEQVYSDALSHIIARDFFPGLREAEAQSAYMQALDSSDKDWIREAGRHLTQAMTPGRRRRRGTSFIPSRRGSAMGEVTPRGGVSTTPLRTPSTTVSNDDFAPEAMAEVDVDMSLAAFQAKYTSEDNESFNALLDRQNEKRAAKYAFFHYGNKIPSARQLAYREREQLLLENGTTSTSSTATLTTTNALGEARRTLALAQPSQDLDARPASVDSFPDIQGPRNSFMFGPDSVEEHSLTHAEQAEKRSNASPKSIHHMATRFPAATTSSDPELTIPPSPSLTAIDAGIAGRSKPTRSESGYTGASTPRVNGYAFVDATPTPSELGIGVPVADAEADAAEQEAATALLPEVEAGGPNPFRLRERSRREELHLRLVEKADLGRRKEGKVGLLRAEGGLAGRTATPRFASAPSAVKAGLLTPAARRLAERMGTPKRRIQGFGKDALGGEGRGGWTPADRRPVLEDV